MQYNVEASYTVDFSAVILFCPPEGAVVLPYIRPHSCFSVHTLHPTTKFSDFPHPRLLKPFFFQLVTHGCCCCHQPWKHLSSIINHVKYTVDLMTKVHFIFCLSFFNEITEVRTPRLVTIRYSQCRLKLHVVHVEPKSFVHSNMRFYGFVLVGFYYSYNITSACSRAPFILWGILSCTALLLPVY